MEGWMGGWTVGDSLGATFGGSVTVGVFKHDPQLLADRVQPSGRLPAPGGLERPPLLCYYRYQGIGQPLKGDRGF